MRRLKLIGGREQPVKLAVYVKYKCLYQIMLKFPIIQTIDY